MEGEEREKERAAVEEVIRREVGEDWDDEEIMRGRYKGFSGQRSDWEPLYLFWRNLIITISRQLRIFIIQPNNVKHIWFRRGGGLSPLCLDHVLLEMYKSGDLLCTTDLPHPKTGLLSHTLNKIFHLITSSSTSPHPLLSQNHLIISSLLRDKALEVVNLLSDSHWTSSCVITMTKFNQICGGGPIEASAILSHLSSSGKAKYLVLTKNNLIEGIKVSLCSKAVAPLLSLDYNVLHLTWTAEKLQQQLDVIHQRCDKSKRLALTSLRSGNKIIALRHAREMKIASESRERCAKLLNRVDKVLRAIAEAEDSNEVSKALQAGARAMKEINTTVEEVQLRLEEVDEGINSQKKVEEALGSTPSPLYAGIEEEDIEDELKKLELEIRKEASQDLSSNIWVEKGEVVETAESLLSNALSKLKVLPQMQDSSRLRVPTERQST